MNVISWSGGKDSTATIILAHELGIKIDRIVMSLLWFDKKRKIYAINPVMLDWILNYAKPRFESWGYKVDILSSDKDYIYWFYKIRKSCRKPENAHNIGKHYGFLIGGKCRMQGEKTTPIKKYLKSLGNECTEFVGICADEMPRIEGMNKRKQRSLLVENNLTQADAREKCIEYNLLAPTYNLRKRDGCWFCPNQSIEELASLKQNYPEYYAELEKMAKVKNTVARGFKYGVPFEKVDRQVDDYIETAAMQISFFDLA